jgi:hypothetical protein
MITDGARFWSIASNVLDLLHIPSVDKKRTFEQAEKTFGRISVSFIED